MESTATSGLGIPACFTGEERRMPTARPRVAWTSPQPYAPAVPVPVTAARRRRGATRVDDPARAAERRRQRWTRPVVVRAALGDAACSVATLSVVALSRGPLSGAHRGLDVAVITLVWGVLLLLGGAYDWRRLSDGPDELRAVGWATLALLATMGLFAYSTRTDWPRRLVLIAVPAVGAATALHRQVLRARLHRSRARGQALMRTLVVGDPEAASRYAAELNANRHHGYDVVAACLSTPDLPRALADLPVWGTVSDVPTVVVEHEIDTVLVVGAGLLGEPLRRLSWALERTGAALVLAPGLVEVTGARTRMRPAAGLSLIQVESPTYLREPWLKSVLDRLLATVGLVLSLPLLVPTMLVVRLTSPGPALYRQRRIGRDGRAFTLYKVRTMTERADEQREVLLPRSDRDGLMFKMRQDPRVTPVGRWLRRYSLDELPQLWNVVRGDMSLVGPRPPLPQEYEAYHDSLHRRLHVKPGITGLWQVSGRSDLSWEESVRLDLRYVDNWSVALDVQILWKTVRAVSRGLGAY